mgnify:CR=1 FL=1
MFEYVTLLTIVWFLTYMYSQFSAETTWEKIAETLLIIIFLSAPIALIYDGFTDCNNDPLNIRSCNNTTPYEDGYRGSGPARTE